MGLFDFIRNLFGGGDKTGQSDRVAVAGRGRPVPLGVEDLAERLGIPFDDLEATPIAYQAFDLTKRSGGLRRIHAPSDGLKQVQRHILRRLLARLPVHLAAVGFERDQSIVTNALRHVGRAVVVRMDIQEFFPNTTARRVEDYFLERGWNRPASEELTRLCTYQDALPQGAPTSPRLSNLVNMKLDARLTALAESAGAVYTRYADDLTFSFAEDDARVNRVIRSTKRVLRDFGYTIHHRRKLHVRRDYEQQLVTGLVVNERVNLPRATRRWLRAVEHHLARGRPASLSAEQMAGWRALRQMIIEQRD